jgi:hypothetical protein
MKNENQTNGTAPGTSQEKQEAKADITKLPLMEMYAVLGLELSKQIFEKLQDVEKSVGFIAAEMQRQKQEKKAKDAPSS